MSALAYTYPEPNKYPSLLLAVAVHAVFFAFLYFGINWHSNPPEGMQVEIWSRLPAGEAAPSMPAPAAEPPKPVETPKIAAPAPKPVVRPRAEINLPVKKTAKQPEPAKEEQDQQAERATQAAVAAEAASRAAQAARAARAEETARAGRASAAASTVNDFIGRIKNKIRHNIIMPPGVPDSAEAEFHVTLLPDGSILNVVKIQSSSSAEYDRAVERAINMAHTLPLPSDPALYDQYFRELNLKFKPKE
jgi:colicin import membrane protein